MFLGFISGKGVFLDPDLLANVPEWQMGLLVSLGLGLILLVAWIDSRQ